MDISSRIHSLEQEIAELTAVLTGLMITCRQTSRRRGRGLKWELITLAGNEWMHGCYEQFLYHCRLFVVPMLWRVNVYFISAMERKNTEANMTEWSKVLRSGRSVFARVGSNPTVCIFLFSFWWEEWSKSVWLCVNGVDMCCFLMFLFLWSVSVYQFGFLSPVQTSTHRTSWAPY